MRLKKIKIQHQVFNKNIRRRVYDALNVLMAMNIISKEKREIRWNGLPSSNQLSSGMSTFRNNKKNNKQKQTNKKESQG